MAKKATTKPAAKRKPRNAIVDNAPQIAELAKRMEAERARIIAEIAAEEEAKRKLVEPVIPDSVVWDVDADVFKIGKSSEITLSDFEQALKKKLAELEYEKEPAKSSSPWRRFMLVGATVASLVVSFLGGVYSAGGIDIGPGPHKADAVSAVFDAQESAFRKHIRGLVAALRSGQVKSEAEATAWMDARFGPDAEAAWVPLLTEESKAFGGKEWTAEKHAAHIERYAR